MSYIRLHVEHYFRWKSKKFCKEVSTFTHHPQVWKVRTFWGAGIAVHRLKHQLLWIKQYISETPLGKSNMTCLALLVRINDLVEVPQLAEKCACLKERRNLLSILVPFLTGIISLTFIYLLLESIIWKVIESSWTLVWLCYDKFDAGQAPLSLFLFHTGFKEQIQSSS